MRTDSADAKASPSSNTLFWTSPVFIFYIAFAVRILWILLAHTYKLKTSDDNFSFGFEMGRIGRSLASGHGFSSPFSGDTGPTAWEPPLYPFLIAAVFRVFGIYTTASAFALLAINSFFSALTCIPIFRIAKRCFNRSVAIWSAWSWALLPPIIFWCTRWIWETSLAALLLALIFQLTLKLQDEEPRWKSWVLFGLLWGVTALTNPSLLIFLPASALWAWRKRFQRGLPCLTGIVLSAIIFLACVTPWTIRNHAVFGRFLFIRSNFGAELRLGNGPGATGLWMDYLHPTKNPQELEKYKSQGEIAYVAERKREAVAFIKEDYGRFLWLSMKRFAYYWGGLPKPQNSVASNLARNALYSASSLLAFWGLLLALKRKEFAAGLFFWLILLCPLVYYFVFTHPRYRHPIEPELLILMAYAICEFKRPKSA
jgi:4-amino-4-deoxy-L-arabinose transferase-like glycosyltransferase